MEYLNHVLGIRTIYVDDINRSVPNYINSRYTMQRVSLDGKEAVFLYPKTELDSVSAVKKHIDRIEEIEKAPVILVLDALAHRQKEYMIRDRIPFIVEGKQIYLPFMAIYLQEKSDSEKQPVESILPSAQMLFLYYIYQGCGELYTSSAAKALGLTPTSISKASNQLYELGLIKTEKKGNQKILCASKSPEELFYKAREQLLNPVKRTIYIHRAEIKDDLPISGYSALSYYSMLSPSPLYYIASNSISKWESKGTKKLENISEQCAVELWRYDPGILSHNQYVDRLSLALSLKNDKDERVEEAVEEMLSQLWEDIHEKRN